MRIGLAAAAALSVLAGCGGGGGDSTGASDLAFPLDAAATRLFAEGGTFGATAHMQAGVTATLRYEWRPVGAAQFRGETMQAVDAIATVTANAAGFPPPQSQRIFYSTAPLRVRGIQLQNISEAAPTPTGDLPNDARVGDEGPLMSYIAYDANDPSRPVEDVEVRWSLRPNTLNTAWLCLEYSWRVTIPSGPSSQTECYGISANGDRTGRIAVQARVGAQTVNFE